MTFSVVHMSIATGILTNGFLYRIQASRPVGMDSIFISQ